MGKDRFDNFVNSLTKEQVFFLGIVALEDFEKTPEHTLVYLLELLSKRFDGWSEAQKCEAQRISHERFTSLHSLCVDNEPDDWNNQ